MKVIAYTCDACRALMNESDAVGIEIITPDLFKGEYEYKATTAKASDLHFCTDCHTLNVVNRCKHIKRNTEDGQKEYDYMYDLLTKKFYANVHREALFFNKPKNRRRR